MLPDAEILKIGWKCKCPQCKRGDLYKPGLTLNLRDKCEVCGLDLSKNDSADGPAVFLIFSLGFLLVPLALLFEVTLEPPLWVHIVIWSIAALTIAMGTLRPLKAYIIALQYKHRPQD
ncbi:MAG: DUF983 domain-containing protein [Alphaproteobacteria bacterium]